MRCDECKFSKVKTTLAPDKELVSQRFCMFNLPSVQLIPTQHGPARISFRPEVEDDDFCKEFVKKPGKANVHAIFNESESAGTGPVAE